MDFDRDLIDSLLKKADIVSVVSSYINVIRKGRSHVALCPFHDDKHPSLQISPDKQIFKCFVCGTGGNAIQFVQKYEKIAYPDAIRKVADLVGFTDERLDRRTLQVPLNPELEPYYRCMNDAMEFYRFSLATEDGEAGLAYLESRHLTEALRARFNIGYSLPDGRGTIQYLMGKGHSRSTMEHLGLISLTSEARDKLAHRVIFPILDRSGRAIAFSGRVIEKNDQAKYVNSPESKIFVKSNVLYNYHHARTVARHYDYVYILEGFMDVIALYRAGIESAVAIMGTALTKSHIAMLRMLKCELRICLDGDDAGQAAMMKMIPLLDGAGLRYRFILNAGDKRDTDEILDQQGTDALKQYLNNLVNRSEFALDYYTKTRVLKTSEQRSELVKLMLPIVSASANDLEREEFTRKLAQASGYSLQNIEKMVKEYRNTNGQVDQDFYRAFRPEAQVLHKFKAAERQLLYFMMHDVRAIEFYKTKIEYFYDDLYRKIANFIIERSAEEEVPTITELLDDISQLDGEQKDALVKEITNLALDKNYPQCDETLLGEVHGVIDTERQRFVINEQLRKALIGKSDQDKARIYAEFQKKHRNLINPNIIKTKGETK